MRKLWYDHVALTREVIILSVAHQPIDAALDRLMKNQDEIAALVGQYHSGQERIRTLLREHIEIAGSLIGAAVGGQPITEPWNQWVANGEKLSRLLGVHMQEHLDLNAEQLTKSIAGDRVGSIAAYGKTVSHIMMMSDALTKNIAGPKLFILGPDVAKCCA